MNFVNVHIDYLMSSDQSTHMIQLNSLLKKMEYYFFNEQVKELEIDKFIEENAIILERGLNLVKPKSQVVLKDVLGKYGQDLKPDVIAFNEHHKLWTIVDYKRNKRSILKNTDTVRTSFKSEVNDLKAQLRDYKEYFEEEAHRDFVAKTYNLTLKYPTTLGLIGQINDSEIDDFNRQMKDEPRWFNVMPYNYLYENFKRYVELADKTLK